MKKQIIVATGLAVLSTSAYATKARMAALGQDQDRGSLYIQDSRNLFRNAAHVNTFKNYVVTEWGSNTAGTADTATAPRAEGGFFREMGAFSYGVYLGNNMDDQQAVRTGNGYASGATNDFGTGGLLDMDNNIDLYFGGDMGIQWGAALRYGAKQETEDSSDADKKREHSYMGLSLGMIMGDLDAYASMKLKDESLGNGAAAAGSNNDKWEGGGMQVGLGYNLGDLRIFADYAKEDAEYTANGASKNETSQTSIKAGVAKTHEVSSSSRVFYAAQYENTKAEDKYGANAAGNSEDKSSRLSLNVGMEAEANSWLTLRGSVSGPVILNSSESKLGTVTTKDNTTSRVDVNAGATLSFGKLKVDGSIGTTPGTRDNTSTFGTEAGVLTLDNLMSRVAVHYWF